MMLKWKEKELEDFIEANPLVLFPIYFEGSHEHLEVVVLGRQIRCRYGIIDLLIGSYWRHQDIPMFTVTVVELKAVTANQRTVEQVLRYMSAIEQINYYKFVPRDDFMDYAHEIEHFVTVESMIVAPKFDESITWYPSRIEATKTASGFDFDFDRRVRGIRNDNNDLELAMNSIIEAATHSAKMRFVSKKIELGMDNLRVIKSRN